MAVQQISIVHQDAISAGHQLESTEHPNCDTFITMDFPFPLFSPVCPLTGNSRHFSTDLAAFERSLHATIPNASLTDFAPLSARAFRQRATGWRTGSVGVTIGEQSATRLTPSGADVVRLCIRFVAQLLPDAAPLPPERLSKARTARLVDEACAFMMTRLDTPPTLTEVESATGASARVLQIAFSAHLGTTPRGWLKEQRLLIARVCSSRGSVDR